jgi:hypothetical protein
VDERTTKNMLSKRSIARAFSTVASLALLSACGAAYEPDGSLDSDQSEALGSVEQGLSAACGGDDSNGLIADLAVAIANELGRWDVNTDFTVVNGKLELSATGNLHCGAGCGNITALLRLQDDASSIIPNHLPATYRSKLTSWHNAQKTSLNSLVTQMLNVEKGTFRIRSLSSNKYIVPSSTRSGAALQQSNQYNSSAASEWRVVLKGTSHQLINVQSGLCADLASNTTAYPTSLVQRACNGSATQAFRFSQTMDGFFIRPANAPGAGDATRTLGISNGSTANGAPLVQLEFTPDLTHQRFVFEPIGSGSAEALISLARAVYTIKAQHSGMYIGVSSGSLGDGATVVQQAYVSTDDRFHWYLTPMGASRNQLINRRTGSCLDLADPNGSTSKLVQRRCSTAESQHFYFNPTGDGAHVLWTIHSKTVDVPKGSTSSGAQLAQGGTTWQPYNKLWFEPVIAGEPNRLSFDRTEVGAGPCGDYRWYDVTQPNGRPLDDPAGTFVQLIFAGGKRTATGADTNPFIAQKVSGDQIAIDPTYGLNEDSASSSGSCSATCTKISSTSVAGQCCSCNGATKKFAKSSWNAMTYLCR